MSAYHQMSISSLSSLSFQLFKNHHCLLLLFFQSIMMGWFWLAFKCEDILPIVATASLGDSAKTLFGQLDSLAFLTIMMGWDGILFAIKT